MKNAWLGLRVLLLIVLIWIFWGRGFFAPYTIVGVPYSGIYNTTVPANVFPAHVLFMVMGYWRAVDPSLPAVRLGQLVGDITRGDLNLEDIDAMTRYLEPLGYEIERVRAESISQLRDAINPSDQVPVLVRQPPSVDYSGSYTEWRLIIGVAALNRRVIAHDVYFGNNLSITADEYKTMNSNLPTGSPQAVIIQPKNVKERLAKSGSRFLPYPARKPIMDESQAILQKVMLGYEYFYSGQYGAAAQAFQESLNDARFDTFPPSQQILYHYMLGQAYRQDGKLTEALATIESVTQLNHDLDQPTANGWPGLPQKQSALIDQLRGQIFTDQKEYTKAREAFSSALAIDPNNQIAKSGLSSL